MTFSNQRQTYAFGQLATGFIQTMYFDLKFNYVKGSVEQIIIVPDAPSNADPIASSRKTGDFRPHLKKMGKAASKKTASKSSKRRVK
jgi:hypothetical protein